MNRNETGFTLVEMLVVLTIFAILIIVGSSIQLSTLENYQASQFYNVLQNDLLYMQQLTIVKRENVYLTIDPDKHFYEIRKGGLGSTIITRKIPNKWVIKLNTLSMPVSFSNDGTVKQPGMFSIQTSNKNFYIYFPFGKGRSYIIEKER